MKDVIALLPIQECVVLGFTDEQDFFRLAY
jgi:hypothetical protein